MLKVKRVLVPVDFSEYGRSALEYGVEFCNQFGGELHLVHVIEEHSPSVSEAALAYPVFHEYIMEVKKQAEETLSKMPEGGKGPKGGVIRTVRVGTAFREIVQYAEEKEIDLVVIGTHGRTGLKHWFLGSVAEQVVRRSPCPVLVIHREGRSLIG